MPNDRQDGCSMQNETTQDNESEEIRRFLEDMIERQLQLVDVPTVTNGCQPWQEVGIQLLRGSQQKIIDGNSETEGDMEGCPPKKRRRRSDSKSSHSEEERSRVQQAAVTVDFIHKFK